jgi:hypothetical protein
MEQRADIKLIGVFLLLWSPHIRYSIHKGPQLDPIRSESTHSYPVPLKSLLLPEIESRSSSLQLVTLLADKSQFVSFIFFECVCFRLNARKL